MADGATSGSDRGKRGSDRLGSIVPLLGGLLVAAAFAWLVARYYFLGDDCFIGFRYARHLTDGLGLVFNPGERVEGYTNFSWVLLIAGAMKLGLAPEVVANVVSIASGVAILAIIARLGARESSWADPLIWIAPLALAVNRTFCAWSTGGLETQFFSVLVLASLVRFGTERERGTRWPVISALVLALATLTRPEGVLCFAVVAGFFVVETLLGRRRAADLAVWAAAWVLVVGAHEAWRLAYYGDPLPNTFYAKVSGFWWEQSRIWFGMFLRDYHLYLFGWLALAPVLLRRDARSLLFAALVAVYASYLVYIGGDAFEFRFLAPLLPYLYFLLQEAVRMGVARIVGLGLPRGVGLAAGLAVAALLVGATYAPNLETGVRREEGIASVEAVAAYAAQRTEEGKVLGDLVDRGYLAGDELLAVGGAGALPYYSGLPALDIRGINDRSIARQEIGERGWIGHEKAASLEYLRERGVVIYDVLNRVVHDLESPARGARGVEREIYRGPLRCVEADGRYLIFATTLTEDAFRRRFARFRILY